MIKRPSLRNPSEFFDLLTVVLGYVVLITVISELLNGDRSQDIILLFGILVFGWCIWAVHRILENQTEDMDEDR